MSKLPTGELNHKSFFHWRLERMSQNVEPHPIRFFANLILFATASVETRCGLDTVCYK